MHPRMFEPNSPVWMLLPIVALYLGMRLRVPRRD
jgi:hypothetical protein